MFLHSAIAKGGRCYKGVAYFRSAHYITSKCAILMADNRTHRPAGRRAVVSMATYGPGGRTDTLVTGGYLNAVWTLTVFVVSFHAPLSSEWRSANLSGGSDDALWGVGHREHPEHGG